MHLLRLISKNFKLIIRNKTSVLALILAPVIIIFLLGLAFNTTNVYNIRVTVYSTYYTELANDLLDKLGTKEFSVQKTDSAKECVEMIKAGESNICLELPPDLSIEKDKTNNIIFHVDPSQINLVWLVLDIISGEITSKTEEISLDLTNIILSRLKNTKEVLTEESAAIDELISANQNLTELNSEIDEKLGTLDLTFRDEKFNITDLKTWHDESIEDLFNIQYYIEERVEEGKDHVSEGINLVGNDSSVAAQFNRIDSELTDINTKAYKITLLNKTHLSKESDLIHSITLNLEDVGYRLGEADIARDRLLNNAGESSELLSISKKDLDGLRTSVDSLLSGIESVKISEAGQIVNPITTTIKPVVEERTHLNYIFAGIVMLIIMFVSILLASNVVVMEKKSKSFLINYLAPTRDITFVLSIYITTVLLMLIQLIIIMGISAYFFKSLVLTQLGPITLILFVSTSLFILVGMLIAYIFKAEQTITLVTISVGSLLLFLSDIILPIESMPLLIQNIVKFNPFLVSEQLLKKVMLFGVSFSKLAPGILYLAGLSVVVFILILLNEKLIKRHFLAKIFRGLFK
ncbi:ABC transporter permease [Candidatus Woesearchaeota archaeon]|nr:ABC transporter permease [Candidatus Woesearchaeota archaeon]